MAERQNHMIPILNKKIFTIPNKKILVIAFLIAIFITGLTIMPLLIVSTDLSYFHFNFDTLTNTMTMGRYHYTYPRSAEFDTNNIGKKTIGQGGFPFSIYGDCALVSQDNNKIHPICESWASGDDYSTNPFIPPLLNILVWTFSFYSFLLFTQALKRKTNRKRIALIFVLAIAILVISVFANDLIG